MIQTIKEIYTGLISFGINPIAVILTIVTTHFIKEYIPIIYTNKHKKIWTVLIATGLALGFSTSFLFLFQMFSIKNFILNSIINFFISLATPNLMDILLPYLKSLLSKLSGGNK